tara:strand:- start:459 stop:974 length:516 start_codon:yes stop_codon:yes gene_type:complete
MSKLSAYFRRRRKRAEARAREKGMRKAFKSSFTKADKDWKWAATAELKGKEAADAWLASDFESKTFAQNAAEGRKTSGTSWTEETFGGMSGSELQKFSKKMKGKFDSDRANQATHKQMKEAGKTVGGTKGAKKTTKRQATKGSGATSFAAGGIGNQGRSGYSIPKITGGAN